MILEKPTVKKKTKYKTTKDKKRMGDLATPPRDKWRELNTLLEARAITRAEGVVCGNDTHLTMSLSRPPPLGVRGAPWEGGGSEGGRVRERRKRRRLGVYLGSSCSPKDASLEGGNFASTVRGNKALFRDRGVECG